jgi:hypothetical protein
MTCRGARNYLRLSDYDTILQSTDSYGEISLEMFNSGDYDIKGEAVNTTDCITTANNLWRLFNPKLLQTLMIDRDNLITPELFQGDTNICIVSIGGGLPYHKFVLVKTSDSWVILCSYAGTYSLRILTLVDPVRQLNNLALGSAIEFNTLFQTDEACGNSRPDY